MLNHSSIKACFEHSDFLTVNDLNSNIKKTQSRVMKFSRRMIRARLARNLLEIGRGSLDHRFDYEPFNCNNFSIRYWSCITAAAGTRLALQLILVKDVGCTHSNYHTH